MVPETHQGFATTLSYSKPYIYIYKEKQCLRMTFRALC